MHVRFSSCRGLPVVDEETQRPLGSIEGILIHPDTGKVEGFFVAQGGLFVMHSVFLSSVDILSMGARASVRSADALAPIEEHLRLMPLLSAPRPVLGQRIETERGVEIGTCRDVQFDSHTFHVEWLFPKKFLRWGRPIPITAVIEVKPEAIFVRDAVSKSEETEEIDGTLLVPFPMQSDAMTPRATASSGYTTPESSSVKNPTMTRAKRMTMSPITT